MKKIALMLKKDSVLIFKHFVSSIKNNYILKKYLMPILIIASLILGCSAGLIFGENALILDIFPKIFMWFIKNLTPYLIFFAIASNILCIGSLEQLKRLGLKAIVLYIITAIFAVIIGITSGLIFHPGVGFKVPDATPSKETTFIDTFLYAPLLSLVVMTLLLAIATLVVKDYYEKQRDNCKNTDVTLLNSEEKRKYDAFFKEAEDILPKIDVLISVIIEAKKVMFKTIGWIIWLAPLAVFGVMANLFATPEGINALGNYGTFLTAFLTSVGFYFIVLAVLLVVIGRLNPLPFFQKIFPIQMMPFSTSSSRVTLPFAMEELQDKLGASERGAKFILPFMATINIASTALYFGLCSVFFAQAYGIDLSLAQYFMLGLACIIGSIGTSGLSGGSIIFMPIILTAVGIPIDGIPIIIAIDRLLENIQKTVDITGDCALALAIDSNENNLNRDDYNKY